MNINDNCSKYFRYVDFIECSDTQKKIQVDNRPKELQTYEAISHLSKTIMDPIFEHFGKPEITYGLCSHNLQKHIDKGFLVSVGAAFDFYSGLGHINRSPKILRHLKLEWLYRVFKQPTKTLKRLKAEVLYMPIIILREIIKK